MLIGLSQLRTRHRSAEPVRRYAESHLLATGVRTRRAQLPHRL